MQPLYTVILNWNQPAATIDCVRSLLSEGFAAERILVVDNGSTDGSVEQMRSALGPELPILRSEVNLGFAAGCNLGIRRALGEGARWVFLLNNDTLVHPGFGQALKTAQSRQPGIHLWGPLILYKEPAGVVWSMGDRAIGQTLLTRHIARGHPVPDDLPTFVEVDSLTGCAIVIHSDVFRTIGLLDESYFMYVEDADFCLRARRAGFRLACWTDARITHLVSLSSGRESPVAREWRVGYQARFYRHWSRGSQRAVLLAASTARTAGVMLRDLLTGRPKLAAATLRGWRMGWFAPEDTPLNAAAPAAGAVGPSALLEGAPWRK